MVRGTGQASLAVLVCRSGGSCPDQVDTEQGRARLSHASSQEGADGTRNLQGTHPH